MTWQGTEEDPTLIPPEWQTTLDSDQHKVRTESGLIDFVENAVREEVTRFRNFEDYEELPEEAKRIREVLQKQIPHIVKVEPWIPPCDYWADDLAAAVTSKVADGSGAFHGCSAPVATVLTFFDAISGQNASTSNANALGTISLGTNNTPLFFFFDRGIKFTRGLFVVSSVATNVTIFHRDTEPDK